VRYASKDAESTIRTWKAFTRYYRRCRHTDGNGDYDCQRDAAKDSPFCFHHTPIKEAK
jgi:hypothetical protein